MARTTLVRAAILAFWPVIACAEPPAEQAKQIDLAGARHVRPMRVKGVAFDKRK